MPAQHPVPLQRGQRLRHVGPPRGGGERRRRRRRRPRAAAGRGRPAESVSTNSRSSVPPRSSAERRVRVAGLHGPGERGDGAAEAPDVVERHDPVDDAGRQRPARARAASRRRLGTAGGAGEVAEHRAGLDRRELVRVADQHQPGVRAHRLEQPGHQRQRHHRRLVDDDHVVGQPVVPVVPEPAAARAASPAAGAGSRPVRARSVGAGRPRRDAPPAAGPPPCRWVRPARSAAVRRGRSRSSASSLATVVVLPVPGPPASTVTERSAATAAAQPLPVLAGVARGAEQPVQRRRAAGRGRPAPRSVHTASARAAELGADQLLLPPVPLEVEQPVDQPQRPPVRRGRPVGDERARGARRDPGRRVGPRQAGDVDELVARAQHRAPDRGQVDAHRPEPHRAHGQREREQHLARRSSPPSRASRAATCTSAGSSTPARVERGQQPGGGAGERGRRVRRRGRRRSTGRTRSARSAPPSSRSDSSSRAPRAAARRRPRTARRRPPGRPARTCRAGTGRARRRGGAPGRSRA